MTVTVDINVLLDVFQQRQPHYAASAQVMSLVTTGSLVGVCPGHGPDAEAALDRVLDHFKIGSLDTAGWKKARRLPFADFEDAVVATVAETSGSGFIITRNVDDFASSPVPAISPADFLSQLSSSPIP